MWGFFALQFFSSFLTLKKSSYIYNPIYLLFMKNKIKLLFIFAVVDVFSANLAYAQFPQNNYQSSTNTYYWKNRKPYEGYWQQDVYYKITASLNDKTDIIDGSEELTYTNNSPDELKFVYFHLYSNAQAKGSYLADLYKNNGNKVKFGKYSEKGLGCNVSKITANGTD